MATAMEAGRFAWEFSPVPRRRAVLMVAPVHEWPADALLRADEMARRISGDLFVLRLFRKRLRHWAPIQQMSEEAHAWCERLLKAPFSPRRVSVLPGRLVPSVMRESRLLAPDLIVLPPGQERAALQLVRRLRVPVLLARPGRTGEAVVAATDLDEVSETVVRFGAELGERLSEPVVFVHNVGPVIAPATTGEIATTLPVPPSSAMLASRREQLERLAHEVGHDGQVMVETRLTAAEGVLEAARSCHADLIVVGSHARSWFDRVLRDSAASDLVKISPQSVMVVPLPTYPAV